MRFRRALLVTADRADLEQLLTALALSGRECLPAGGRIVLSAFALSAEPDRHGKTVSRPSVVVRLDSSGYGVQPVVWQQASELATRLGGRLDTRREAPDGSRLDVVLPRVVRLHDPAARAFEGGHHHPVAVTVART